MHANARIGSMMYVWCMPSSIILQYVRCKWSDDQFSGRLVLDRDMILRFAGSMMGFMHVWHSKPFKATLSILTPQNYGYFGSPPNTTAGHTGSNKPWPIGPGPIWSLWKMLFWGCQNWDPKKKKKRLAGIHSTSNASRPAERLRSVLDSGLGATRLATQRDLRRLCSSAFMADEPKQNVVERHGEFEKQEICHTPWETTNGWNLRKALLGRGKAFTNPPIFQVPLLDVSNSRFFLRIC